MRSLWDVAPIGRKIMLLVPGFLFFMSLPFLFGGAKDGWFPVVMSGAAVAVWFVFALWIRRVESRQDRS